MKHSKNAWLIVAGAGLASALPSAGAEDSLWPDTDRIGLSYRVGINISARFKNLGSPALSLAPSLNGVSYSDGFVGMDSSGNAGGLTSNWGYQQPSQVVDNHQYLLLQSSRAGAVGLGVDSSPCHGLELSYNHEFARFKRVRLGVEAAFNWVDLSAKQAAPGDAVFTLDAYPLGYAPPQAPFTGTPNAGPFDPLLGVTAGQLPALISSDLTASLYGFRLGPYLDIPLGKRMLVTASTGLALTLVDGLYEDTLSYTTPGGSRVDIRSRASSLSPVFGGYASLQGMLKIQEHIHAFMGIQYQGSDQCRISAGGREAQIDFRKSLYTTAGVGVSF